MLSISNFHKHLWQQQGFCFGFVEFESPEAVQKAIEVCIIVYVSFGFHLCMYLFICLANIQNFDQFTYEWVDSSYILFLMCQIKKF